MQRVKIKVDNRPVRCQKCKSDIYNETDEEKYICAKCGKQYGTLLNRLIYKTSIYITYIDS